MNKIYIQIAGISLEEAREIVNITTTYADIPEPLRIRIYERYEYLDE